MLCYIYRCNLKSDMYIYLAEEDVFDNVPKDIYNSLGIIEFSISSRLLIFDFAILVALPAMSLMVSSFADSAVMKPI